MNEIDREATDPYIEMRDARDNLMAQLAALRDRYAECQSDGARMSGHIEDLIDPLVDCPECNTAGCPNCFDTGLIDPRLAALRDERDRSVELVRILVDKNAGYDLMWFSMTQQRTLRQLIESEEGQ